MSKICRYRVETFGAELVVPADAVSISPSGSLDFYINGTLQVSYNSHTWDAIYKLVDEIPEEINTAEQND